MGSLMPGWATSPSGTTEAMKRSKSSLTKEELERFWRSKQLLMQQHLEEANKDAALSPKKNTAKSETDETDAQQDLVDTEVLSSSLPNINPAWWTKSKWAFLNDPPTVNTKQGKYVAQFTVATAGQPQTESTEHPAVGQLQIDSTEHPAV